MTTEKDDSIKATPRIEYHQSINRELSDWAQAMGTTADELRTVAEQVLRTWYRDAPTILLVAPREGQLPKILKVNLGIKQSAVVFYTVEMDLLLVRGFGWETDGEPRDDFDSGSCYSDFYQPLESTDDVPSATRPEAIAAGHGPRIYVASLSDYNAGRLHGRWIDAEQDAIGIRANITVMLAESTEPVAEEWAIHDYEGFGDLRLGEFESIDKVSEVARLLSEHGEMFGGLVDYFGGLENIEDAKACMDGGYHGAFNSLVDYVYQFIDDCYGDTMKGLPDFISNHLDYEGMAHDLKISGDVFTIEHDGEVHVFSSNY